jgi:hypothetical protein
MSLTSLIDHPIALFLALFLVFLITVEAGHRLGLWLSTEEDAERQEQVVAARDGTTLLLSLLLGFTLAMGLTNYDLRKRLITAEANSIGKPCCARRCCRSRRAGRWRTCYASTSRRG